MTARTWTGGVERRVLPNGLTILVQRDASAPVVAVVTHVRAGFFDEPDRWLGISHVLEHMFFKGTPTRGVGEIARATKAAGGYLNAHTSYDHTAYYVVLPARELAAALDIQSDALRNSVLEEAELARELQVIIQEARRKLDTPSSVTHEVLHEVMYDRHRIRRWRIGHETQLATFRRADVAGYYESRYVPSRTIMAIVGDVNPDVAVRLAEARYAAWVDRPAALDPSPDEPPRTEVRARTLRGDVAQAELAIGWRAVGPLDPDATALDVAAAVLASGRGSWLHRTLRQTGIVTSVGAHFYAPTELGLFTLGADLDPDRLPEAVGGMAEAVSRLALLGPADADVERARRLLETRWARRMESMDGRAAALATAESLGGLHVLDDEYAAIQAATPGVVREATARWLAPDSVSAVAYLPHGRGRDLTAESLAAAFAVTALTPLAPPPRRTVAPASARRVPSSVTADVHHAATDGADILVRRKPGVPLVMIGVYVPRLAFEAVHEAGLGALTLRAAARGAGGMDSASLAFAFERLGGTLATSAAVDWVGYATTVVADELAEAAELLRLVFTEPALDDESVASERRVLVSEAEQAADDMFRYPFQLAFGAAFGDRGYGLPVGGTPESVSRLSAAHVRRWHQDHVLGGRPTVIAVGELDPERAATQLAGVFRTLAARAARPRPTPEPWPVDETRVRVVERDKAQTAIAMAFSGPSRRESQRHAADVLAAVASGLGGRLFEALRDRRSLAYTVFAQAWQRAAAGAWLTYIATSPDREGEAREEMLRELARFASEEVTPAELTQAVNYLAGQTEVRRQSGAVVLYETLEAWLTGEGLSELSDAGERYRAVSARDIRSVAERFLQASGRGEGIVRGRSTK